MNLLLNTRNILWNSRKIGIIFQLRTGVLGFNLFVCFSVILCFVSQIWAGLCPLGCECENKEGSTVCTNGELIYIPQFLTTSTKQLKINCNRIKKIDGSLNYYDKVKLSTNTNYYTPLYVIRDSFPRIETLLFVSLLF